MFFLSCSILTLKVSGEVLLAVLAAFMQAESENYSALVKMVFTRKYQAGIPVQYLERSFEYTVNEKGEYIRFLEGTEFRIKF